jgi:hypothetical protein
LKKARWLLLRSEQNLKREQRFRLCELLRYDLKTVRARQEKLSATLESKVTRVSRKVPREWRRKMMRSHVEPMKKIGRHADVLELILNYFRAEKPQFPTDRDPAVPACL